MFGNLFGDDEEGFGSVADATSRYVDSKGIPTPPRPRLKCNLAGITNQGATCYLNSLLQTLLLTPEFRESLFQIPREELGNLQDREKIGAKVRVIPLQLQRLFVRVLLSNRQSVSTRELTESFGWSNNEELQQHDVQELNRILFSAISDSLAGTSGTNLIEQLYHGSIVNQIKCMECETCREREEDFLDLTLTVAGNIDLKTALCRYYQETELMDGKNQYKCETCNKLVNAKKGAKLRKLPPILSVSLLRFSYDFQKMERYKESGKFSFPLTIDMAPYSDQPSVCDEFELFSIVIHQGGAYGGHYHAYIRDVDNLGTWYNPDDAEIQLIPSEKSKKLDVQEFDSPLQLIEALLNENNNKAMELDKLGSAMVKRTGVSWNSRFKQKYGAMTKFLRKHDDVFEFNQSKNMIHLKSTNRISDTSNKEPDNQSTDGDKTDVKCRPELPPPEEGRCWYDFDDARVFPIRTSDIEKQFHGRESAYMLFYRRKNLPRPSEARNNPSYCIGKDLLAEVEMENRELEKQRADYDELINKITLQIHFSSQYNVNNGVLETRSDSLVPWLELMFDRRLTMVELLSAIMELGGELVPSNPVLNRIKESPAGLHVFECLTGDVSKTVGDVSIVDGDKILVWDGNQIGNSEPPVYTIVLDGENSSDFSIGFTKNNCIDTNTALQTTSSTSCDNTVTTPQPSLSAIINSVIKLTYAPVKPVKNMLIKEEEIILDNTITVQECLDAMLLQSGLPGENWHLRKTNWCGEPTDVLDDLHMTLNQLQVQDGDHLLIEEGRLPVKGFLILTIWLYPLLSSLPTTANQNSGLLTWFTNGLQGLLLGTNQSEEDKDSQSNSEGQTSIHMGEIDIWKESTLEELKMQILTLPKVARLALPSIYNIRVRLLNNLRPSTILRDHSHTIKRHKIRSSEDIAIQVLPTEEKLSTSEIVLEVRQHIAGTKTYTAGVEVIWDISTGTGIDRLQHTIADALSLPVNQILLAKYQPAKCDWLIIKEKQPIQSKPSSGKGKKGKRKVKVEKMNLRQAPFYISDGDVIGVKDVVTSTDDINDFNTEEDIIAQQELGGLAEEKKMKRKDKKEENKTSFNMSTPKQRRPEVALTIKVDKFT
ncbi:ubiquitin carboxyl-terminal hydrolase 40 [Patella vulgata]|uniref:ubiquitin carboxyl-terminal hydrolase 40 n=1 Tax=Patella vulgata TaxID=6465 RepID=UPI0024A97863|nr:ubiquitin carboxyl-terminal hydrolase 40 [Patella vulgata]